MNLIELDELEKVQPIKHNIAITDLQDKSDRTLLYGYTCDRASWHFYLKDLTFYLNVSFHDYVKADYYYNFDKINLDYDVIVPDKRLYPECCDYEFCKILKEYGINLPFTTFEEREYQQYYGKVKK